VYVIHYVRLRVRLLVLSSYRKQIGSKKQIGSNYCFWLAIGIPYVLVYIVHLGIRYASGNIVLFYCQVLFASYGPYLLLSSAVPGLSLHFGRRSLTEYCLFPTVTRSFIVSVIL
jgi:hypothetical protein